MRTIAVTFLLMGILLWVPASNADIYTWTDENGVKHFGNQPPDNAANATVVFQEEPHDEAADQKRTATQNEELTELIRELDEEEEQQAAEARKKAAQAEQNREMTQDERIALEKRRLEEKIADLVEQPLEFYGSERNKRARIGYYRYRLETLMSDPDKYFNKPERFEGNVKNPE